MFCLSTRHYDPEGRAGQRIKKVRKLRFEQTTGKIQSAALRCRKKKKNQQNRKLNAPKKTQLEKGNQQEKHRARERECVKESTGADGYNYDKHQQTE
jgi:hypothetical protein